MMETRSKKATAPPDRPALENNTILSDQEIKAIQYKLKYKEDASARQVRELEEARQKHEENVRNFDEFS